MEDQGFNVETMELAREIFIRGEFPSEGELQNHPDLWDAFWSCEGFLRQYAPRTSGKPSVC